MKCPWSGIQAAFPDRYNMQIMVVKLWIQVEISESGFYVIGSVKTLTRMSLTKRKNNDQLATRMKVTPGSVFCQCYTNVNVLSIAIPNSMLLAH